MTNTTPTPDQVQATIAKLTAKGRETMLAVGQHKLSFFDEGIVEGGGIWGENLTGELGHKSSGVINRLQKLGLWETSNNGPDGMWWSLTALGAAVANVLAAPEAPVQTYLCTTCLAETDTPGAHAGCTGTAIADHAVARITAGRRAKVTPDETPEPTFTPGQPVQAKPTDVSPWRNARYVRPTDPGRDASVGFHIVIIDGYKSEREVHPQRIRPHTYGEACAPCHGARTNRPCILVPPAPVEAAEETAPVDGIVLVRDEQRSATRAADGIVRVLTANNQWRKATDKVARTFRATEGAAVVSTPAPSNDGFVGTVTDIIAGAMVTIRNDDGSTVTGRALKGWTHDPESSDGKVFTRAMVTFTDGEVWTGSHSAPVKHHPKRPGHVVTERTSAPVSAPRFSDADKATLRAANAAIGAVLLPTVRPVPEVPGAMVMTLTESGVAKVAARTAKVHAKEARAAAKRHALAVALPDLKPIRLARHADAAENFGVLAAECKNAGRISAYRYWLRRAELAGHRATA